MAREADYGPLNCISRNRIKTELIRDNWGELLQVADSLKLDTVTASEFVGTLKSGSRTPAIAAAIAVGRIAKSLPYTSRRKSSQITVPVSNWQSYSAGTNSSSPKE